MTINKSQGQSVKHVGLDLLSGVFSHGQLYVALSQCTLGDLSKSSWTQKTHQERLQILSIRRS
ncbi:hypothetical protein J132_00917 [Termitomyces sp. J132]|nr:hypothetical protein J132_00917 [Termitomyces sp. J132]